LFAVDYARNAQIKAEAKYPATLAGENNMTHEEYNKLKAEQKRIEKELAESYIDVTLEWLNQQASQFKRFLKAEQSYYFHDKTKTTHSGGLNIYFADGETVNVIRNVALMGDPENQVAMIGLAIDQVFAARKEAEDRSKRFHDENNARAIAGATDSAIIAQTDTARAMDIVCRSSRTGNIS
jgi:prepilin-type processing-associated H-X9-DG protein